MPVTSNISLQNRLLSQSFEKQLLAIKDISTVAKRLTEVCRTASLDNAYLRNAHLTKDGAVTFLPKGKESVLSADGTTWDEKGRQSMKVGKFVRAWAEQWSLEFYDSAIEEFVNLILAEAKGLDEHNFKVVKGEDILKFYHESQYATGENLGTLASSCMRNTAQLPFLKLYANNPDRISMVCLFSRRAANKITGRALVWQTNKGQFMDRIYADDANTKLFIKWARANDTLYCHLQNREEKDVMSGMDTRLCSSGDLVVTDLVIEAGGKFPYLDTMKCLYPGIGIAAGSTKVHGMIHWAGTYQGTGGIASQSSGVLSKFHHGLRIPNANAQAGYACYKDKKNNQQDYFFKYEMFQCHADGVSYNLINMVIGIDGNRYVCDSPEIVYLTGERIQLCCLKSEAVTCFYDGLLYYGPYHTWKKYTLVDVDGVKQQISVRDLKLRAMLTRFNLELAPGSAIIKVPGTLATYFTSIVDREAETQRGIATKMEAIKSEQLMEASESDIDSYLDDLYGDEQS